MYYRTGDSVREVRIPEDHSHVKARRVVGESQEGRANLEEGGAKSTEEAAEEKQTLA